jgi:hypothetical protein
MKAIFILTLFSTVTIHAQVVNIPDLNFLDALKKSYVEIVNGNGSLYRIDTNNDGLIQEEEAERVKNLTLFDGMAYDFTGLEAFKNLTSFKTSCQFKTEYDFSQNKALEELALTNYGGMTELNVSDNPKLLSLLVVSNQLQVIDVRNSPDLIKLNAPGSPIQKIYVYDKEYALKLTKIGAFTGENIVPDTYEQPNVILSLETSMTNTIHKNKELELGAGELYNTAGVWLMSISQTNPIALRNYTAGLYIFRTTQGQSRKLHLVD